MSMFQPIQGSAKGMDVEAVRQLADQVDRSRDQIEVAVRDLETGMGEVPWQGTDADRFSDQWRDQVETALRTLVTAMDEHSSDLRTNADEQEQTSGQ